MGLEIRNGGSKGDGFSLVEDRPGSRPVLGRDPPDQLLLNSVRQFGSAEREAHSLAWIGLVCPPTAAADQTEQLPGPVTKPEHFEAADSKLGPHCQQLRHPLP